MVELHRISHNKQHQTTPDSHTPQQSYLAASSESNILQPCASQETYQNSSVSPFARHPPVHLLHHSFCQTHILGQEAAADSLYPHHSLLLLLSLLLRRSLLPWQRPQQPPSGQWTVQYACLLAPQLLLLLLLGSLAASGCVEAVGRGLPHVFWQGCTLVPFQGMELCCCPKEGPSHGAVSGLQKGVGGCMGECGWQDRVWWWSAGKGRGLAEQGIQQYVGHAGCHVTAVLPIPTFSSKCWL